MSEIKGGAVINHEIKFVLTIFIGLIIFILPHTIGNNEISINAPSYSAETALIDLNSATADELDSLMYVGREEAELIVRFREENGAFENIQDIERVDGLTPVIRKVIIDNTYAGPTGGY